MTDNPAPKSAPAGNEAAAAGIPFYEKQRQHLKELITKRRLLEKRLVSEPPRDAQDWCLCVPASRQELG
jgi:chromatin modification-related protein EAF6